GRAVGGRQRRHSMAAAIRRSYRPQGPDPSRRQGDRPPQERPAIHGAPPREQSRIGDAGRNADGGAAARGAQCRRRARHFLGVAEGPEIPDHAPGRYLVPARIEISGYRDWAEIGQMMAPLYETAVQLAPDSPLQAEIARIAALGPDPRKRAMAALQLVQDKVR